MNLSGFKKRIAQFTLKRNHLREVINRTGSHQVLKRFDHPNVKGPVADRHHNIGRNATELFIGFINVRFHSFIEEGIENMVCIELVFFANLGTANIGAVVPAARHFMNSGAMRFNHANFRGARAFFDKNLATDTGSGSIGRHSIARVATGILNAVGHANRLHVRH